MAGLSEIFWSQQAALPLLVWLQAVPLAGALLLFILGERPAAVLAGKLIAFAVLALAAAATWCIDPLAPALQLAERFAPLAYHVAIDGVSAVFILVAALLTFLMTLYGMSRGMIAPGRLFAVLLLA